MKFYVCSGWENREFVSGLASILSGWGWKWTFDWTSNSVPEDRETESVWCEAAEQELEGVSRAELVLVLLPGARGTHVELGAALALGKPVVIWSRDPIEPNRYTCPFYWHRNVTRIAGEWWEFVRWLRDMFVERSAHS